MPRLLVLLTLALSMSASMASDMPRRKSGLWDMAVLSPGMSTAMTMQQCVDEKSDDIAATIAGGTKEACQSKTKREGGGLAFESACKFGKTTATTRGMFTGDFNSNYAFEAKTTFNPPSAGMREGTTKATARWTGPCKAGMKPGDVVMSNGTKFNVNDPKFRGKK